MPKPAIFIDRDGTLIEEVNYLSRVEDLQVFAFTADAIRTFKELGYLVIVVTNQSGIGRGIYTIDDMQSIHDAIQLELDGAIDGFYFCPHVPGHGCSCRKPSPGMIDAAQIDHDVDVPNSWMIGDKLLDVLTGSARGMRTAMVLTGYGQEHSKLLEERPNLLCSDLGEVARELRDQFRPKSSSNLIMSSSPK